MAKTALAAIPVRAGGRLLALGFFASELWIDGDSGPRRSFREKADDPLPCDRCGLRRANGKWTLVDEHLGC
jgi:hypothetical protein